MTRLITVAALLLRVSPILSFQWLMLVVLVVLEALQVEVEVDHRAALLLALPLLPIRVLRLFQRQAH